MFHHEVVDSKVFTTITPIISESPRTIDKGLLRKSDKVSGLEEIGTFQSSDSSERPTRSARGLILDGSYGSVQSPVQGLRCTGQFIC